MTTARLGVRLARRELRRRPWRTALVVLMVLIPTAAMATAVIVFRTSDLTPEQEAARWSGAADVVGIPEPGRATNTDAERLLAELPDGTEVAIERRTSDRLLSETGRSHADLSDVRLDAPVVSGRFGDLDGRLPTDDEEIVLTDDTARKLEVGIGDVVRSSVLDERPFVVVGVVMPADPSYLAGFVTTAPPDDISSVWAWVDLPGRRSAAEEPPELNIPGWSFSDVYARGRTNDDDRFWSYVGGGLGLIVCSTVIAAAFAIGARRQLRTIGLLSAGGASPKGVAWFLVAQGAVAGFVGSVLGGVVGVIGTHAIPDRWLTYMATRDVHAPVVRLLDLVPVVLMGTVVAAGAAWVPARSAARVPTLQALAGRRPLPAVPARLPAVGAALLGVGCACFAVAVAGSDDGSGSSLWAVQAIVGGLALLGGVLAAAPWLIAGLERAAARLPEAWRLAGRSLARARVRSSAVVGAVATVAAAVVAGGALYASGDHSGDDVPYLRSDQVALDAYTFSTAAAQPFDSDAELPDDIVADVVDVVGPSDVVPVVMLDGAAGWGGGEWPVGLATAELLDLLGVPDDVRAEVDAGAALVLRGADVLLRDESGRSHELRTVHHISDDMASALPSVLVGPALAEELGLRPSPYGIDVLVRARDGISDRERDRLDLVSGDLSWAAWGRSDPTDETTVIDVRVPDEEPPVTEAMVRTAILVVALLLMLAVLAVGLAMAAKDSDDERQVLAAVGAPPRTLRKVGARRAALLAMCAAVLAIPTGLLPAAAVVAAQPDGSNMSFRPDFVAVAFVAVVVPLAAGGGAALVGRLRDAVRPVRPDSFGFAD